METFKNIIRVIIFFILILTMITVCVLFIQFLFEYVLPNLTEFYKNK